MGRGAGAWRHRREHSYTGPQLEQADGEPARASPLTGAAIPSRTGKPARSGPETRPEQGPDDSTSQGLHPNNKPRTGRRLTSARGAIQGDLSGQTAGPNPTSPQSSPRQSLGTLEASGPSPGGWTRLVRQSTVQPRRPGRRQPTIKLRRPLTQSRASPGKPQTLRASTRATHPVAGGPGTCQCCNLQSSPGGPDSDSRHSSSSGRSLSPKTVPGDPKILRASTWSNGPE